jgi:apolipoprotein N-acyltransferase
MAKSPREYIQVAQAWLQKAPLMRAFLWGLAAATALPPVHFLPALLFSVPAFLRLLEAAGSIKRTIYIAWCYGFGLAIAGLYWVTEPVLTEAQTFWWLVPFAAPAISAAVACYTIIPALAVRWVKPGFGRLLVFAGAWVLSNIAQQFWFSGFPWNFWGTDWTIPGRLGDVFIQPAAWVSVHGLTLATVILAGLPLFGKRGLAALVVALAVWAGAGWARLQTPVAPTGLNIAMLQPNFTEPPDYSRPALEANWRRLLAMSNAALNSGADAIIWPEAASPWLLTSDYGARQQLAEITGTTPVIAGTLRMQSPTDFRNSLVLLSGPVPPLAVYDKWKLVPFGEYMPKWLPMKIIPDMLGGGFTPGTGPMTITAGGLPPFAPLICYEDVFPGQMIDEARRPSWLVVITDDAWFGDSAGPYQHYINARLRAVEEGLPLARAGNSGITAMFDPFGHVIAYLPLDTQGVLVAPLPGTLPPTLFSRLGLILPAILSVVVIISGKLVARRNVS